VTPRRRVPLSAVLSLVVLATTVPLALFSAGLTYFSWQNEQQNVDRQNVELVRAVSGAVDDLVQDAISALGVIGSLAPPDPADLQAFSDVCRRAVSMHEWQAIFLVDPSGRVLMSTDGPFGAAPAPGAVDWIDAAVGTRRPAISNVSRDPASNEWAVTIGVPIVSGNRIRYVIGARFLARRFADILRRQDVPTGGVMVLLDRSPAVVARTLNETSSIGRHPTEDFVQRTRNRGEGIDRTTTFEGMKAYGAWTRSPVTDWIVGMALPAELVNAPIRRSFGALVFGAISITALGWLIALHIRNRVVGAQRAAADTARALVRGEPVTPTGSWIAEIQDLSAALADAEAILETRLRERDEAQNEVERQRTALLESEKKRRREAEALSAAKDEFVATVSHELRTPLNAILGWVHLLQQQPQDAGQLAKGLEVIRRNAATQLKLIEDLLDVSRMLRGAISIDVQVIDLAVVVEAAITTMRPAAEARGVALAADVRMGEALVRADWDRLQQVVFNVMSNALKFTPEGGRIDVRLSVEGNEAVLRTTDTGEGIAPEFLPYIFDRFRQEASNTPRTPGGIGLGLSLSKHLTELHGGTISAESEGKGRGATLTVRLPLVESPTLALTHDTDAA